MNYVVATIKPWNLDAYARHVRTLPGQWTLMSTKEELTVERLTSLRPRYIFFPHWSWIVPDSIIENWDCVCFHMADVPYGRGGSPLQNLIVRGHQDTQVSALRMVAELDAGPVYLKHHMSLGGSAHDIFCRFSDIAYTMIREIVEKEPAPTEQTGDPVVFTRRTPDQSQLPLSGDMSTIYDHIRMLDAPTYPGAFLRHGDFRLDFNDAKIDGDTLTATVRISRQEFSHD